VDLARMADTLALMLALGASATVAAWVARKRWWGHVAVGGVGGPVVAGVIVVAWEVLAWGGRRHLVPGVLTALIIAGSTAVVVWWSLTEQGGGRWSRWKAAALVSASAMVLVVLGCLCAGWPGLLAIALGVAAAAEAVAVVLAKFVRWGWVVFLTACLLPRVERWRRVALGAAGLFLMTFGVASIVERHGCFPPGLGPPQGFRVAERANAPEAGGLLSKPLPFERARFACDAPRGSVRSELGRLERRLRDRGWGVMQRGEGALTFESPGDPFRIDAVVRDQDGRRTIDLKLSREPDDW